MSSEKINEILQFWFGDNESNPLVRSSHWFTKSDDFDSEIKKRFESDIKTAVDGKYDSWLGNAKGTLAYIVLLDQFSRNIYRGTPKSFAQDSLALDACLLGIQKNFDKALHPIKRWFFYMPLEHSEDIEIQQKSLKVFKELLQESPPDLKTTFESAYQFSHRHYEVIKRFGRFPHRNVILGRKNTRDEDSFLKQPGSSF